VPRSHNPLEGLKSSYGKGDPDQQTAISPKTKNLGNPESYAAQQIAALAYPAKSLTASLLNKERSIYTSHISAQRQLTSNAWHLVGPRTATQPAVLNFFDFQAKAMQVSGRVTAIALDPSCGLTTCPMWAAAAGGGLWKTPNALASVPSWTFISGAFGTNAIGALTYDQKSGTLYAGTGELNASSDSEAGVGIYKSTDGGSTWSILQGSKSTMNARGISSIVVDPKNPAILYVGTGRSVRGVTAVTGGAVTLAPDAAPWGLYKSTNGGLNFSEVWDGNGSARGITNIAIDSHRVLYASAFGQGIWRSKDGGSTWEQVFATQDAGDLFARTAFALNTTSDGHTRIYVGDGGVETDTDFPPHSNTGVYRADSIDTKTSAQLTDGTANPGFVSLTDPSEGRADPTYDYCSGQCWYDNQVISPAGHPDFVYVLGSFDYNLYGYGLNDGRGILLSRDAGANWLDETRDNASPTTGGHPDQHALAVDPANPLLFFEGSDGGLIRSSGKVTDASANCPSGAGAYSASCTEMLRAVPTKLTTLNVNLSTLQFQGIAINPTSPSTLIGGTQDNGTWLGSAGATSWSQTIYGDGGVPAFDAGNSARSLNEFYYAATDANFENGDPTKWVIVSAPFANSGEASEFYKPQIGDPVVSGTNFVGLQSIWRTQDWGGDKATLEANCPEFTTFFNQDGCGDYVPLGDPAGNGGPGSPSDLTGPAYGSTLQGGAVVAMARTTANTGTLWAATATGRVFISQNAAGNAASVKFTRIDDTSTAAPSRFISGIVVSNTNPNRAWVAYTGYNENTPSTPGHVFRVDYDPSTKTATWTNLDANNGPLGDLPVTTIARDDQTGTVYVGTDFTVLGMKDDGSWGRVSAGMPMVEIADLKIDQASGTMYAGTHGRGIWKIALH
jgi:hypothetical protein